MPQPTHFLAGPPCAVIFQDSDDQVCPFLKPCVKYNARARKVHQARSEINYTLSPPASTFSALMCSYSCSRECVLRKIHAHMATVRYTTSNVHRFTFIYAMLGHVKYLLCLSSQVSHHLVARAVQRPDVPSGAEAGHWRRILHCRRALCILCAIEFVHGHQVIMCLPT